MGSVGDSRYQKGAHHGEFLPAKLWARRVILAYMGQAYFNRHFAYRALGLIVLPFFIYLFFFWIHFKILIYSGPGDTFMSPAFQETLQGNELLLNSQGKRAASH